MLCHSLYGDTFLGKKTTQDISHSCYGAITLLWSYIPCVYYDFQLEDLTIDLQDVAI